MSRLFFLSLFFINSLTFSFCQQGYLINQTNRLKNIAFDEKGNSYHPSIVTSSFNTDSFVRARPLKIFPILDIFAMPGAGSKNMFDSKQGGMLLFNPFSKLYGEISLYQHLTTLPEFVEEITDSLDFIPGYGNKFFRAGNLFSIFNVRGNVTYSPFSFLNISMGNDKHFLGNGHRSLFLSDNAPAYPYFSTSLKIWHIEYKSITNFLNDIYHEDSVNISYKRKFATIHYISWNITPTVNLDLFESVLWRGSDSVLHNGMNMNYLNPVVFMRPVEYSQGSTDNALLGAGFNILFGKNTMFYSQAILDEFYMKEIKNKGYRDNKFGYQLGIKGNLKNIRWLLEMDQVRPFTYSHYHSLQNYGHMRQALAHPLGANFREFNFQLFYDKGRFYGFLHVSYARYGKDSMNSLHGQDIYKNYWEVDRFGHYLFDGVDSKKINSMVKAGYLIKPAWNMAIECGYVFQDEESNLQPINYNYFFLGLKTLLYNDEWFTK